ncbi:hypothetical protein EI42_04574 [Thermosporothrix hazakensis]|jgi:hypothetical protein|uniref:Uncharacterized protein n=1 Tax=Thermosporothrix hazakensis TaxID=644383 RepID=A0A326U1D2_THEHA|nr:hypothetical protein [Thermosporothrix hazakensis]PZW24692.1 hypothetical protein EI42_04574 [Thermosporothrix hazakensis]GCE48362.1 hypothetical protein KTH_32310 [Thermosporothrix hazakensis]
MPVLLMIRPSHKQLVPRIPFFSSEPDEEDEESGCPGPYDDDGDLVFLP